MNQDHRDESISFYDKESSQYSKKRYEGPLETYVQFFFRNRLKIVKNVISKYVPLGQTNLKLMDIGCADGVITRSIARDFSGSFSRLLGVDISPKMIEVAKKITDNAKISFILDTEINNHPELRPHSVDVILALGFLMPAIFKEQVNLIKSLMKENGVFVCTFSSRKSLHAFFKMKDDTYKQYKQEISNYSEYRNMLSEHFDIIREKPNGLFIPKLWAFPALGRMLQPIIDKIFAPLFPNLFHEKIYVMRLK